MDVRCLSDLSVFLSDLSVFQVLAQSLPGLFQHFVFLIFSHILLSYYNNSYYCYSYDYYSYYYNNNNLYVDLSV